MCIRLNDSLRYRQSARGWLSRVRRSSVHIVSRPFVLPFAHAFFRLYDVKEWAACHRVSNYVFAPRVKLFIPYRNGRASRIAHNNFPMHSKHWTSPSEFLTSHHRARPGRSWVCSLPSVFHACALSLVGPKPAQVHSVNERAKVPRWQAQAKRREAQRESANLHNIFCCFFLACSMPWRAPPFLGTHTERAFNSCLSLSAVSPESARACCVLRASEPSCWEEEARRCSRSLGVLILSRSFANQVGFGFFHARCPLRCAAYSKRICTCC